MKQQGLWERLASPRSRDVGCRLQADMRTELQAGLGQFLQLVTFRFPVPGNKLGQGPASIPACFYLDQGSPRFHSRGSRLLTAAHDPLAPAVGVIC